MLLGTNNSQKNAGVRTYNSQKNANWHRGVDHYFYCL